MKVIAVLVVGVVGVLVASSLVVKDGDVTVKVNEREYNLTKNQKLELEAGAKVCVKSGDGTVVVANQLQLSAKSSEPCVTLAKKKEFNFKAWLKKNLNKVAQLFVESKEQVKLAVTREAGKPKTAQGEMLLHTSDEYLVINNRQWTVYPITLEIINNKNKIIDKMVSSDDYIIFIIPRNKLRDGYKIKVYNSKEKREIYVDISIKLEDR